MDWEAPSFVEIKMDAEINSYQDDFKDIPDVREQSEAVAMTAEPISHR
jgi:coenzyme PQQ precursor peptide PqqA